MSSSSHRVGALAAFLALSWQAGSLAAKPRVAQETPPATVAMSGGPEEATDDGPRVFPYGRPAVYRESGIGDRSHPYNYATVDTLRELTASGDGVAAWHLSSRYLASDMTSAKYYAVVAAVLLGSGEPILLLIENHLADNASREEALPYLLLAGELGSEERVSQWLRAWNVSDSEREAAAPALRRLREAATAVRESTGR